MSNIPITDEDMTPANGSKMVFELHRFADDPISMELALTKWNALSVPEKMCVKTGHVKIFGQKR